MGKYRSSLHQFLDESARTVGYADWPSYLASDHYKALQHTVFQACGQCCRFCNETAITLYFASYQEDVLRGERFQALLPVCVAHKNRLVGANGNKPLHEQKRALSNLMRYFHRERRRQRRQ